MRSLALVLLALGPLALGPLACSDDSFAPLSDAGLEGGHGDGPRDGGGKPEVFPTVTCPNPALTPPASGTCTITPGGAAVLVRGTLLLPDKVAENGHLLVEGGKITCAGCDCSKAPSFGVATVVECAKGVISAGLINTHDHIGWTTARPVPSAVRYNHRHQWRVGDLPDFPEIKYPGSNYKTEPLLWGEVRMLLSGVTSIMGEGGIKGLVRNLDKDNGGLGKPDVVNGTFPLGDSGGQMLAQGCGYKSIPSLSTIQGANAWVPHVAEGNIAEARNEFLCLSGQQAGGVDATQPNASFIHAVGLTAVDIRDLALGKTGVVWSPRSNISLYGMTAEVVEMDHLGVRIALGTDWVISGSMNMLRELACADELNRTYYDGHFSDRQLYEMVAINGALTAGVADVVGELREGTFADLAVWNGATRTAHGAVVRATLPDVVLVLRGGEVLYGDEALVNGLDAKGGEACEPLEVCGAQKRLCLQRETGKDLAALKAVVGDAYPLFFCEAPTDEPTCVPSRPNEYDGKITATDSDGDGIPDDQDSCPKVFNPVRPIDGGKQPDTDGDKLGDECDPCPFDVDSSKCSTKPDPNDKDGDKVADADDTCPTVPNADQKDGDGDKLGDACDACPTRANPGGAACPFTVRELRDRSLGVRPADGTLVALKNLTVTAVRTTKANNFGFYVREGTAPFEALFVFTKGATPADAGGTPLKPGDRVNLEGKLVDYSNTDELEAPAKVEVNGSGDLTPVDQKTDALKPGSATAEAMESQLVKVSGVKVGAMVDATKSDSFWVSDSGADCTAAAPTCTKVTDFFYDGGVFDQQPAAPAGALFSAIVGVVNGFKNDHTLEPRGAADLVAP